MARQCTPCVTGKAITPTQPMPFSHEHHAGGLGIGCRCCHISVEASRLAGLPPFEAQRPLPAERLPR